MTTKINCPNCETEYKVTAPKEPHFCSFCAEFIKLYEDPMKEELDDLQNDKDEDYGELFDDNWDEDDHDDD